MIFFCIHRGKPEQGLVTAIPAQSLVIEVAARQKADLLKLSLIKAVMISTVWADVLILGTAFAHPSTSSQSGVAEYPQSAVPLHQRWSRERSCNGPHCPCCKHLLDEEEKVGQELEELTAHYTAFVSMYLHIILSRMGEVACPHVGRYLARSSCLSPDLALGRRAHPYGGQLFRPPSYLIGHSPPGAQ